MAPRPIAAATIAFGLVSIPVKLFTSTQSSGTIRFRMLDGETKQPVKQQYIRPTDGKVVPRDDMVKGYEYAKDQFVVFTPEELKALEEEATKAIAIEEFVPLEAVDPDGLRSIEFDGKAGAEMAAAIIRQERTAR